MGKKKTAIVYSYEALKKKNTKELLGYLKALQQCEESFELSDMDINEDILDNNKIYFKQTPKWKSAYNNVKSILSQRENIVK
jgi:hypothetical protein